MATENVRAIQTAKSGEVTASPVTKRMLAILKSGDLGQLTEDEQLIYYVHECERMGLDPAARPLEWVRLQGKLTLYAKRVAGDMLAAKHKVSVDLVTEPTVKELCGAKFLYARARATMPDGRYVEDVGTLPFSASGIDVAVMKLTSKTIRRTTLRLCGWGGLDESELETIPRVEYIDSPALDEGPRRARQLPPSSQVEAAPDPAEAMIAEALNGERDVPPERLAAVYVDCLEAGEIPAESPGVMAFLVSVSAGASPHAIGQAIRCEQALRDYDRAKSRSEVEAIDATVAAIKLAKSSAARTRLVEARKRALARTEPKPPTGGGAPKPEAANDTSDPEREGIAAESADSPRARLDAYVRSKHNRFALERGVAKHWAAFVGIDAVDFERIVAARLVEVTAGEPNPEHRMSHGTALNAARAIAHHAAMKAAA